MENGSSTRRATRRPRVVVLGGGFAGLSAVLEFDPARYDVTLIDRRRAFEWLPNIHELLSGVKTADQLRLPLDRIVKRAGHRFSRDTVESIDPDLRTLTTRGRRTPLAYDALILALGGVDVARGVEGVKEHALGFKSVAECERIGKRVARLASESRPRRVVIVGGGLEGVEALGEILRRHRHTRLEVTVVDSSKRLLTEAPAELDGHVRRLAGKWNVSFVLGMAVEAITADSLRLEDGRTLPSDLTIWTGGPGPSPLLADSGLAPSDGWAPVEASLQSARHPDVFIAGDAAELPSPIAKQAYHALDMGVHVAKNVARWLAGEELAAFQPSEKPMLVSFGDLSCFLVAGSNVVAGPALAAGKEAVYGLGMAQLDAGPWWRRLSGIASRTDRAARRLWWPTVSSPKSLARQFRLSWLAS